MLCHLACLPFAVVLAAAPVLDRQVLAMGTRLDVHLEGEALAPLQAASEQAVQEVDRIEAACSTWRPDSAWSRLNAAAPRPVPLAPEWLDLLTAAQAWARATGGAFDPALGPLLRAWGVREGGRTPTGPERALALRRSGSAQLEVDRAAGTARLRTAGAGVEEGGFVKGYALDRAHRVLTTGGAAAGFLDFGGQVLAWGPARAVRVAGADDRTRARLQVRLEEASLAVSGCGTRGRHLLDPRTGRPCPDWGSVAVVAATGLDADILSTALYVLGPHRGLAYARRRGLAAAFLPHGGAVLATPAFLALRVTP